MPKATLEEDRFAPSRSDSPPAPPVASTPVQPMDPILALGPAGHLGGRDETEKELDLIAAVIRSWWQKPPDLVMRECSAFTARLTELQVLLHRVEAGNPRYTRIRTQQVERFIAECERQWRTASRLVEVARQDLSMIGAQV